MDAEDDLLVDGIGDPHRGPRRDQAEVGGVLEVGVERGVLLQRPGEHRPEDAAHGLLSEAGQERVEVGGAGEDQPLLRGVDVECGVRRSGQESTSAAVFAPKTLSIQRSSVVSLVHAWMRA